MFGSRPNLYVIRSGKFSNLTLGEYVDEVFNITGKMFHLYSEQEQFELLCNFFDTQQYPISNINKKFASMNTYINAPHRIIP